MDCISLNGLILQLERLNTAEKKKAKAEWVCGAHNSD